MHASDSDYTVMSIVYGGNSNGYPNFGEIPAGSQIDFQIEAFVGYSTEHESTPDPLFRRTYYYQVFTGESSGWSDTQTVTANGLAFGVETTVILEALIVVIVLGVIVGLLVYFKKRNRQEGRHG